VLRIKNKQQVSHCIKRLKQKIEDTCEKQTNKRNKLRKKRLSKELLHINLRHRRKGRVGRNPLQRPNCSIFAVINQSSIFQPRIISVVINVTNSKNI
jgi:hypothetical protein